MISPSFPWQKNSSSFTCFSVPFPPVAATDTKFWVAPNPSTVTSNITGCKSAWSLPVLWGKATPSNLRPKLAVAAVAATITSPATAVADTLVIRCFTLMLTPFTDTTS